MDFNYTFWSSLYGDRKYLSYILVAPVILIILTAFIGNILTILVVIKVESLRKVGNSFIVSLAVSDLLLAAGVMPVMASYTLTGNWMFYFICVITGVDVISVMYSLECRAALKKTALLEVRIRYLNVD